jgi:diacylglycerol O-acyltransferase / wax synthase
MAGADQMDHQTPVLSRRLSGVDAAFLYLERKEIPLNIACVALFDGPIPFRKFVAHIDSKLDLIPRYRQVAVPPPFNLGYPTWEYDQKFDIRRHIFQVHLDAPGGEAELEALAGRLLSQTLDRSKPLWEIHLVEGLRDGRGALIARIHHALADGVAGAALLRIMLDPTPEGSHALRRPGPKGRIPKGLAQVRTGHSLAEQLGGAIQSALENAVAAEAGLLSLAEGLLSDQGKTALQELATLLPEWLHPPERFPFNKPCSGDRKFCWTEASFADVQAIRDALGGKVNDCVLSVVVRAVARYIRLHGEEVKGRFLRVVCPVNLRGGEQGESMGNRITFLPVVLPLDVSDPVEMLHVVSNRMEIMKSVHAAELLAIAASCLGMTPAPVQELFWRGLPLVPLPLPLLNMICTNVPGSPMPLYAVGRRMVASYPQVPTGYELGLGVAVQSYDGKLFFGLIADAHVAPDVARLRDYIQTSFEELVKAAAQTQRSPKRKSTRGAKAAAREPEPAPKPEAPVRTGKPQAVKRRLSKRPAQPTPVVEAAQPPAMEPEASPVAEAPQPLGAPDQPITDALLTTGALPADAAPTVEEAPPAAVPENDLADEFAGDEAGWEDPVLV